MEIKKVKEFIKLAKDEGVASLKVENDDFKISVSFATSGQVVAQPIAAPVASSSVQTKSAPSADPSLHEITSPFVGTYYGQSAPGEPEFVKVGDRVSKGQTLCILEAMKIMNEIECDVDGEIVEICLGNESLVEFGEVLFRVRV
jgi:acetyl-CoA carboxylase biotin carboxyl carrier protein